MSLVIKLAVVGIIAAARLLASVKGFGQDARSDIRDPSWRLWRRGVSFFR